MVYCIRLRPSAIRDLKHLPSDIRKKINAHILSLANDPRPHGVEKLSGRENIYRIRASDYRILYEIKDAILIVLVIKIAHRREAYR
ncbi:MAG: type II toxin-antitoxin system RelE/ParE family toxin [Candidatus Sumerlaeota bacterium]|nr:type II toxin-antitoxin system RelE/ParE family toxin [Candidatus Sumerlaeota bacterium]